MFFGGNPFEHMHGGGGGGGMPGGRRGGPREEVDTTSYYEALGVEKTATAAEIKKAFRKLAMKKHPDRGGNKEEFQALQSAAEVLMDPEKRELYDKFGKEGAEQGGGGGGGGDDIFSQLFGGGRGGRRGPQGPPKGENITHPLKCSLEDLYNGKTVKLAINREVQVDPSEKARQCSTCNGQGAVMRMRQLGPGMIQQFQTACPQCKGKGHSVRMKKERKILEVCIEKGMKHGSKIKFMGEADQMPGQLPGDVVFVVQQKEHDVFKRKAHHLIMEHKVTLAEALTGLEIVVKHLDGRELLIKTKPGQVITPGTLKRVASEGMPMHGNPFVKGNLIVAFDVQFPKEGTLSADACKALRAALPTVPPTPATDDADEYDLDNFSPEMLKADLEQNRSAYDSDDEEEGGRGGGQGVQCQQS
jgi:DnaJ homolog subfamily A member 2